MDRRLRRARPGLGLLGPVGVVRRVVRTVGVWAVPLALAYLAWWALGAGDLGAAWHRPGDGGLSVWQGTDLVVAVTVSWIPLAADYTRFSRDQRSAFWGTGIGYFVPDVLLLSLGAVLLFTRGVSDAAALPPAVAAGGLAAFVALLALTVAETDDAFANAYSGAVSSQNLFPWIPQRALVVVTTSLGVVGALTIELPRSRPSCSCSALCSCRSSRCCSPTGWSAAGGTTRSRSSGRRHGVRGCSPCGCSGSLSTSGCSPPGPSGGSISLPVSTRLPGGSAPPSRPSSPRWLSGSQSPPYPETCTARGPGVSRIAVVGNLCVDRVAGGPPRPGGPVLYAAHASGRLGADVHLAARCAGDDADVVLTPLEGLAASLVWQPGRVTTAFAFHYEGEHRVMAVEAVGDPWTPEDITGWAASALDGAEWVHVGALLRSDFGSATLRATRGEGRRLLVDAQGLVRHAEIGPLRRDGDVDAGVLEARPGAEAQ